MNNNAVRHAGVSAGQGSTTIDSDGAGPGAEAGRSRAAGGSTRWATRIQR